MFSDKTSLHTVLAEKPDDKSEPFRQSTVPALICLLISSRDHTSVCHKDRLHNTITTVDEKAKQERYSALRSPTAINICIPCCPPSKMSVIKNGDDDCDDCDDCDDDSGSKSP